MNKNKGWILGIVFLLIGIVLCGVGYFLYNKTEDNGFNDNNNLKLNVYGIDGQYSNDSLYVCKNQNLNCKDVVLELDVETKNAVIVDVGGNKVSYGIQSSKDIFSYVLYVDNGLKLYDINNKNLKKIDMNLSDSEIVKYFSSSNSLINGGFIYSDNSGNSYYYDLKSDKKLFVDYDHLTPIYYYGNSDINSSYLYGTKDGYSYVLDIKNNKAVFNRKTGEPSTDVKLFNVPCDNDVFFVMYDQELLDNIYNIKIYNQNGKEIAKVNSDEEIFIPYCQNYDGKNAFSIYKKNIVRNYDTNGNLVG